MTIKCKQVLLAVDDNHANSMFGGVCFVDVNRQITYWNGAAESITG